MSAFERLHPRIQRWVIDQGWTTLRDAQEQAIGPILDGADVIVSAATATGKTEAAFLPICSVLAADTYPTPGSSPDNVADIEQRRGIQVLCVSPLKALIDDQWTRLEQLCAYIDVPVHRWHGDVASSVKQRIRENPSGLLLITPESLEATFVNRGPCVPQLLGAVRFVVIDELHAFIGTPRGAQLQSLLNRVEVAIGHGPPRIGLSATLADPYLAARFLRPDSPDRVRILTARDGSTQLDVQLRGYTTMGRADTERDGDAAAGGARHAIADHIYTHLRGGDHLVFVNSRRDVELYTDLLARRSNADQQPSTFYPHHGSLSSPVRHAAETALKDTGRYATVIATSTLELGIDVGSIESVAQIGPPTSAAALRQRYGRSGRRGDPAVLRVYVTEAADNGDLALVDQLRTGLVHTIATIDLVAAGQLEAPNDPGYNYSTLIQQTLSMITERGGATAARLYSTLVGPGPFQHVDTNRYQRLLRCLADAELIYQTGDRLLLPTTKAERLTHHPSFYAAFHTPEEWRLTTDATTLGTLPVTFPLVPGHLLVFAGKRWRIRTVDPTRHTVDLVPAAGGNPPTFTGELPEVGEHVRRQMIHVYSSNDVPDWLDAAARILLAEARDTWQRLGLASRSVLPVGNDLVILPWVSDRTLFTLLLALHQHGLDTGIEGPSLVIHDTNLRQLRTTIETLLAAPLDPHELATLIPNHRVDKWDWALDDQLGIDADAARRLNITDTTELLQRLHTELSTIY